MKRNYYFPNSFFFLMIVTPYNSIQLPQFFKIELVGVCLHDDGDIFIETDNGDFEYGTGLTYFPERFKEINLEYDHGTLTINGVQRKIKMNEYNGDNILSSINFSSGNAFHGYIHSVRVYNIEN